MADGNRPTLARLLQIDALIRTGDYPNCNRLADLFAVSTRTINRDLEFLREQLQAPVEYCPRHRGYFYTVEDYRLPWFQLAEGELTALFLAERLRESVRGTPYEPLLAATLIRMEELLPNPISISLHDLSQVLSMDPISLEECELEQFQTLSCAVHENHIVELTCISGPDLLHYRIHPYHLAQSNWGWQLIGFCEARNDVRRIPLSCIRNSHRTEETFTRPEQFDPQSIPGSGSDCETQEQVPLVSVQLWFSPSVAEAVRRKRWHSNQSMIEQSDGSLLLDLQVEEPCRLKRWILSWGGECKVLAPGTLRETILNEALNILAQNREAEA